MRISCPLALHNNNWLKALLFEYITYFSLSLAISLIHNISDGMKIKKKKKKNFMEASLVTLTKYSHKEVSNGLFRYSFTLYFFKQPKKWVLLCVNFLTVFSMELNITDLQM